MNSDAIYRTIAQGSPGDRTGLLAQLPPDDLKGVIGSLIESDRPGMPVVAFSMLSMKYANGQDPELGAALAGALHRYGVEVFESGRDPGLLLFTLSALAFQYANAQSLLGRFDEVIRFTEKWIPYYESRGEIQNVPSLKTARIAALLNQNQLDAAEEALADPKLRGNVAADIEIARLEKKLADIRTSLTAMKRTAPVAPTGAFGGDPAQQAIERALRELGAATGNASIDESTMRELAARLGAAPASDPSDPETYQKLIDSLREAQTFLTHGSTAESQWTIKQRIREATSIFVLSKTPTVEALANSLAQLTECEAWARDHGDRELVSDALWGMYLCHSRLKQPSQAADVLIRLRVNLEARREGIADPLQRGGIFAEYPHLFDALCEKLQQAGRVEELLEAIEASKGRGIADILTKKAGRPVADADIYRAARHLPNLTVKHRFNYLTFYVDEERTYAVLVTKRGEVRSADPVPLGRSAIREAALHVDPRDWDQPRDDDPSLRIANAAEILAGLVGWLQNVIEAREIDEGDHLCYAIDEDLANVPLQYLRFGRGTLADSFSISKIHNVLHLNLLLDDARPSRPAAFLGVVVPTAQNVAQPGWRGMRQALWQPIERLRTLMTGNIVSETQADIAQLPALPLERRVVHLSTHGVFPEGRSPFEHSGIVLASAGALPDESVIASGADIRAVLTPSKVLDFRLNLSGSHVSLMSCVSGLSREGRGGDALGLEWAMMQAGASSLLASHWYVSARLAAEFFERFYQHWLGEGLSRAAAHARTIKELQDSHGGATDAWAAFSLIGDWR